MRGENEHAPAPAGKPGPPLATLSSTAKAGSPSCAVRSDGEGPATALERCSTASFFQPSAAQLTGSRRVRRTNRRGWLQPSWKRNNGLAGWPTWTQTGGEQRGRRSAVLSARELELLEEFAGGCSLNEVAEAWALSAHTVRTYARNILPRLNAHTRAHAVALACSEGVSEPLSRRARMIGRSREPPSRSGGRVSETSHVPVERLCRGSGRRARPELRGATGWWRGRRCVGGGRRHRGRR
jgi:DNA-binding CsgD family transcriptional regulator